jgi:hypothetical protein
MAVPLGQQVFAACVMGDDWNAWQHCIAENMIAMPMRVDDMLHRGVSYATHFRQ